MGRWVGFLDLKKDNVRGVEKHYNVLYCSQDIKWVIKSRRMRRVGHVAGVGKRRGAYRDLVGKLEGERPFGRPKHRWDLLTYLLTHSMEQSPS